MTISPLSLRLFVAAELPQGTAEALASLQVPLRRKPGQAQSIRWVDPHSIHLTLKFLGDVPEDQVAPIVETLGLAAQGQPPFTLRFGEPGAFPSLAQPRVLWVSLEGDLPALSSLYQGVEEGLVSLGFPAESRAFSPHLTLARVRQGRRVDGSALVEAVRPQDYLARAVIPVDGLLLIQSALRPQGPIYTPLWRGPFGSP